jgi:hypothetical protein
MNVKFTKEMQHGVDQFVKILNEGPGKVWKKSGAEKLWEETGAKKFFDENSRLRDAYYDSLAADTTGMGAYEARKQRIKEIPKDFKEAFEIIFKKKPRFSLKKGVTLDEN